MTSGNRNSTSDNDKTCDARRKNQKLSLNPLEIKTISSIRYKSNGIIYSDDSTVDNELNNVLNLNCISRQLPDSRKKALDSLLYVIKKKHPSGPINDYCMKLLDRYQTENPKKPYVGIMISWLKKHIS